MLVFLASFVAHAQTVFTGTVLDENQVPLPGATVVVKGTTNGVATDFDGNFSIELNSSDDIIVVSYIGYIKQEFETANKLTGTISLQPDSQQLDEVVVTALEIGRAHV